MNTDYLLRSDADEVDNTDDECQRHKEHRYYQNRHSPDPNISFGLSSSRYRRRC